MLTQKYRPKTFSEVYGQEIPKQVLSEIAKNPEHSPKSIILEGGWGTGKCVTPETRVHTKSGYLRIGDILKGEYFGDNFYAIPNSLEYQVYNRLPMMNSIPHQLYYEKNQKVITISGTQFSISGTSEHKVQIYNRGTKSVEWKKLGDIKHREWIQVNADGQFLFSKNPPFVGEMSQLITLDQGWIFGTICAKGKVKEGCISLELNEHSLKILQEYPVFQFFGSLEELSKGVYKQDLKFREEHDRVVHEMDLMNMSQKVPEWIFRSNKQIIQGFLGGILDSQNTVLHLPICSGTQSFLRDVQHLFNLLGIFPHLSKSDNEIYHLFWDELDTFKYERINLKTSRYMDFDFLRKGLEQEDLLTMNDVVPYKEDLNYFAVEKIEEGFSDVYDLSIPESHCFIANGLFNHNTTSSRIFAKAVNCRTHSGDACNKCDNCLSIESGSPLYAEYDSGIVGNVEDMKALRDTFGYSIAEGYRVHVLDECHLMSTQSMSLMLKILEEAPPKLFFLWVSTDSEKLLKTIHSRSIVLTFEPLSDSDIKDMLVGMAHKEQIDLDTAVVDRVVRRVAGHARDALQQVELWKLLGTEKYLDKIVVLDFMIEEYLNSVKENGDVKTIINKIVSQPVSYIKQDFDYFTKLSADRLFLNKEQVGKEIKEFVFTYLKFHKYLTTSNDWYVFLTTLAAELRPQQVQSKTNVNDRFKKV